MVYLGVGKKINEIVGERTLQWEHGLRVGHKSLALFRSHYYWTIGFFALTAAFSEGIGIHQIGQNWLVAILVAAIVFLILIFPSGYRLMKFREYDMPAEDWPTERF